MDRLQAYIAIFRFMEAFWEERKAEYDDELPTVLGMMNARADDGYPWIDANWHDWIRCFPEANTISTEEAYAIMECYWRDYLTTGESETRDVSRMVQTIEASKDFFWQRWVQIVARVLNE